MKYLLRCLRTAVKLAPLRGNCKLLHVPSMVRNSAFLGQDCGAGLCGIQLLKVSPEKVTDIFTISLIVFFIKHTQKVNLYPLPWLILWEATNARNVKRTIAINTTFIFAWNLTDLFFAWCLMLDGKVKWEWFKWSKLFTFICFETDTKANYDVFSLENSQWNVSIFFWK